MDPKDQRADMALGLPGEAAEVAELVVRNAETLLAAAKLGVSAGRAADLLKKEIRDRREITQALILELGDVLFYVAAVAHLHAINLDDVVQYNIEKLSGRS